MAKQLGPLVIECDSPPYCIVQATRQAGIERPEDVRWARLSRHFLEWEARDHAALGFRWHGRRPRRDAGPTCVCGKALPKMGRATFRSDTGSTLSIYLGQCGHCRTVFWDEG